MLISDISHQVKTPVSNLQMVTDTLLTKPVSEEERMDFFKAYAVRLINWIFCSKHWLKRPGWKPSNTIRKKDSSLFHTLAQAMSSIVYAAEKRNCCIRGLPGKFDNLP